MVSEVEPFFYESKEIYMHHVYIIRSTDNQLYIGQTNNIEKREKEHISKSSKSAKFVRDGEDFQLVYTEEYPTRKDAMEREKQLKGWTRAKKEALISGDKELLKALSKRYS